MDICGHCHNVLPRTTDRCTVCGTERVDPQAADVRRREDGDLPSHAPGWAAPSVPDSGIHPDDFVREITGEEAPAPARALPPRQVPATPTPGALAGYLGTTVDRSSKDEAVPAALRGSTPAPPSGAASGGPSAFSTPQDGPAPDRFGQHLSTATNVAPDGVAARTTRLDGAVKLGPTESHRFLTIGAPLLGAALLIAGIMGSYNIRTSQAEEVEAAEAQVSLDAAAVSDANTAVVRLDLDGCGIIDRTTGFLFADRTILVPQSAIATDHRPTVHLTDGTSSSAETLGWSLTRNLAIVRADDRLTGGLEWGVSSRVKADDIVSVLAISGPGIASPVPATITETNTMNGRNVSFGLDIRAAEGSVVLNADGFVIGVFDAANTAQASDDVAPAVSRLVLANERPRSICPVPPTTLPPSTLPSEGDETQPGETQPDE